jgi:hypothetical protein
MNQIREEAQRLPPYVPFKTFTNFVDSLVQGMPGRIDRTVVSTMSGAMQNQLFASLRYLGLIDEQGIPQDALVQLVEAQGPDRQRILKSILQNSYTFLFSASGFSLANATWGQFEGQFKGTGASGDTIRKCIAFFLAAAKDAEIPLSHRITKAPPTRTTSLNPTRQRGEQTLKKTNELPQSVDRSNQMIPSLPLTPSPGVTNRSVQLRSGGILVLSITANTLKLDKNDREFVFDLIERVEEYEQASEGMNIVDEEESPSQEGIS